MQKVATGLVSSSFAPALMDNQDGFQVHTKTELLVSESEQERTLDPLDIVIKQEIMETEEDTDCIVVDQVEVTEVEDTSGTQLTSDHKWSDGAVVKLENESFLQNFLDTHSVSDIGEETSNSQQQAMRMHRRQDETFQNQMGHTCFVCGKVFDESQACNRHMWQNHAGENNCHICGKAFEDKESLRRHGEYHRYERPFSCDVCGITFKRKSRVQKHVATYHPKQWPYSCDLCNRTFKQKYALLRHLAVCHPGQRCYSCDLCEETFNEEADFWKHLAVCHPGEMPFSCDVCEKTFKEKAHVQLHFAKCHSNGRPYSCDVCERTFKRKEHVQVHLAKCLSYERTFC